MVGKPMNNAFAAMFRDMVAMVRERAASHITKLHDLTDPVPDLTHASIYRVCAQISCDQTGDEAFAQVLYLYVTQVNEILPSYEQS